MKRSGALVIAVLAFVTTELFVAAKRPACKTSTCEQAIEKVTTNRPNDSNAPVPVVGGPRVGIMGTGGSNQSITLTPATARWAAAPLSLS
jgi:hypothetical protein